MPKVLVVDDESDIRDLLVDTLLDAGFQVIDAADGESALQRASRDQPDIILLDVWMPGMDGYEVLWRLKEDPRTKDLPVILLTAVPAAEGEQVGMDLGVSHYISNPWDPGVVEAGIRIALSGAAAHASDSLDDSADEPLDEPIDEPIDEPLDAPIVQLGMNPSEGEKLDSTTVVLNVQDSQIYSIQNGMARMRRARKQKPTDGEQNSKVIKTGEKLVALERVMEGGISMGSVILAVGSASSGKSVLSQHLSFGALEQGYGAAIFTSEHSEESLVAQMASIGMNVANYKRKGKLEIYGVPEADQGQHAEPLLAELGQSMDSLSLGAKFIAIDSITDLAGSCPPQSVIAFFTNCRRLGNLGRTIFVSIHSYAFGAEMFERLRSLCDGYITLGSQQMHGRQLRTLEVNKVNTTELTKSNSVSLVVEPGIGMQMIPVTRVRA